MARVWFDNVMQEALRHQWVVDRFHLISYFVDGLSRWTWLYITGTVEFVTVAGRRVLQFTPGQNIAAGVSWSGPGSRQNVEIVGKMRQVSGATARTYGLVARGGGTSSVKQGYIARLTSGTGFDVRKYNNAGVGLLAAVHPSLPSSVSFPQTIGSWYNLRMRVNGNEIVAKVWADGQAEPANWMIGGLDGAFPNAGATGFFVGQGIDTFQADNVVVIPTVPANVNVFLMEGQSNSQGTVPLAQLPSSLSGLRSTVKIWNGSAFVTLEAKTTSGYPNAGNDWGAEMNLGDLAATHYGATVYIIKHAVPTTPLTPTSGTTWNTNVAGSLSDASKTQYNNAIAALAAAGASPVVRGFFWQQGERDATLGVDRATYAARLTEKFADVRAMVGNPNLPIVDMLIYGTDAGRTAINGAKADVAAAIPGVTLFDSNNPAYIQTDNLHLNGAGQLAMGEAAFNVFK